MPTPEDKDEPMIEADRDTDDRGVRQKLEALIPELVKKTLYAGIGAALSTEEGIRKLAGDFSLPKDVANYLMGTAQATKDEVAKVFSREVREFLEKINLSEEIAKVLTALSLEVKTEIRFIPNPNGGGVKPEVKRKIAVRRAKDEDPASEN